MDTKILFELLLYIEALRTKSKDRTQEEMYIACRNLVISFYNERTYIAAHYGKFE